MDALENRTGFTEADREVLRAVLGEMAAGRAAEAASIDPTSALASVDQAISMTCGFAEPAWLERMRSPHLALEAALTHV